jgi:hypothetical protein
MSERRYKIGQLVNYLGRDRASGSIRSRNYFLSRATPSIIVSRTSMRSTSASPKSTTFAPLETRGASAGYLKRTQLQSGASGGGFSGAAN